MLWNPQLYWRFRITLRNPYKDLSSIQETFFESFVVLYETKKGFRIAKFFFQCTEANYGSSSSSSSFSTTREFMSTIARELRSINNTLTLLNTNINQMNTKLQQKKKIWQLTEWLRRTKDIHWREYRRRKIWQLFQWLRRKKGIH